jgi:uncharacterized protein YdeI (YjbR/CyaY-like superfamily)
MRDLSAMAEPRYFSSPAEFGAWLKDHHASESEILVGFWKKGTGRPSMTWPESVDEALCFGWIDGVRRSVDDERYTIRFTPRTPRSIWSRVNMAKVEKLLADGRMHPAGLSAWERRTEERSGIYSFERDAMAFEAALERRFRRNARAWRFCGDQPPGYRKQMTARVMSAKRAETRERRLDQLIDASARGERLL